MYEIEMEKIRKLYDTGLYDISVYKNKIRNKNLINCYETFINIPFTYKNELRDSKVFNRTNTLMKDVYGIFSSSGTTGDRTFYVYNKNDKIVNEIFVEVFFKELEIGQNDLGGIMTPINSGVMAHAMMWQFTTMGAGYINCSNPSPENIISYIDKVPITVIATRPTVASNVAYNPYLSEIANKSSVKKLLLGGGFLSRERRKLLEKVWDAKCYNMFGMSEMFGPMAAECKRKNGLHYLNNYLFIEIIDPISKLPVALGEPGVAVYTTLWEKGLPLLRYWTDDIIHIDYAICPCGSANPRLFYHGRLTDCYHVDNRYVFPEAVENILFLHGFIGDYLIYIENKGITIHTESLSNEIPIEMKIEMNKLFGKEVEIVIVTPCSLGYDGHGKRFVIRE